jgi:hypothetical protein
MDKRNRARRLRDLSPTALAAVRGAGSSSLPTESLSINFEKLAVPR